MLKILGARVIGFRPELVLAVIIVNDAYKALVPSVDCILRFAVDGTHSRASKHYAGMAFDVRIHNVPMTKRATLVGAILTAVGPDFDVVWEAIGTDNEHIHIELDPKTGVNL